MLLSCACAPRAGAQGVGVRAGVSGNPDQFYGGVHYESEPLIEQLRFRPNLEIGAGDNQTLVALNFEFVYKVPLHRQPWSVYIGAGPALNVHRFTNDTQPDGGFNITDRRRAQGRAVHGTESGRAQQPEREVRDRLLVSSMSRRTCYKTTP